MPKSKKKKNHKPHKPLKKHPKATPGPRYNVRKDADIDLEFVAWMFHKMGLGMNEAAYDTVPEKFKDKFELVTVNEKK